MFISMEGLCDMGAFKYYLSVLDGGGLTEIANAADALRRGGVSGQNC